MLIIDRHVFSEWLKSFLMCLLMTVGLIVLEDMYNDLPELIHLGANLSMVLKYYCLVLPSFLPLIIPLAFLASLLYSLGNLHRNNEITAMRASGIHILCITRSLWWAGGALVCILFILNGFFVPYSVEQSRQFYEELSLKHQSKTTDVDKLGIVYNLSFSNAKDNRLWFFNRWSEYSKKGYGVSVYMCDADGVEVKRIVAKECFFDQDKEKWMFIEGKEIDFDLIEEPIRSLSFDQKLFKELNENPSIMQMQQKKINDLSFRELNYLLDYLPKKENSPKKIAYTIARYKIFAAPFACIVVLAIAIPFVISGVRANPLIGISKTIGLLFIYYFLLAVATKMGESGWLPPIVAVWLPMGVMLIVSGYFYKRL